MSALISDAYRAQNEHLHATTQYGVTAPRFMQQIEEIAEACGALTVLDYGSGKNEWVRRHLDGVKRRKPPNAALRYQVRSYDPCVPALAAAPEPADLLVSCDVLEHIEGECLGAVLDHMAGLALRAVFLTIATRPAKKHLPDGRNAHLIIQPAEWWLPRLMGLWRVRQFADLGGEIVVIGEARRG